MKTKYLPILMYHQLTESGTNNRYTVLVKNFKQQIDYLHNEGFTTILPEDIPNIKEKDYKKVIMVTFDDGYETDYAKAAKILRQYGYKVAIFITTSNVGKQEYMNWEQIKELAKEGFSIQSHTHTHHFLSTISENQIRKELAFSKKLLEEKLNNEVDSLALPGGHSHKNIKKIVQDLGYKYIFSSKPGTNQLNNGKPLLMSRMLINQNTSFENFKQIVSLNKNIYLQAYLKYCFKCTLRTIIGPKRYYNFWARHNKEKEI